MAKRRRDGDSSQNSTEPVRRSTRQRNMTESAIKSEDAGTQQATKKSSESSNTETKDSNDTSSKSKDVSNGKHLTITEKTGDLFSAPPNTVLIHACNCRGYWGKGIAAAFKKRYPKADKLSTEHCAKVNKVNKDDLPGTAQLIPPQEGDADQHFVGCLFTSKSYGQTKDQPPAILKNTSTAIVDLLRQVAEWNAGNEERKIEAIWTCKINSGLFNVPWEDTKKVMEEAEVPDGDFPTEIVCMTREE
ncbi:Macro domain-containing protein [Elsinoe fawcettii]|nr:Macro domain-containing protein [Elsinoe fawcettii]